MEILGKIGDVNPVDHNGGVIIDAGYGPQLVYFQNQDDIVTVYRVFIAHDTVCDLHWPDFGGVADYIGTTPERLLHLRTYGSTAEKAQLYADVASYHGWTNLDSTPQEMSLFDAEKLHDSMVGDSAAAS